MNKDLIPLQNSNAFQTGSGAERSDWDIRENITNRVLFTLPKTISDKDMFAVRKFVKQYELEALNAGIQFQKTKQDAKMQETISDLRTALQDCIEHNTKLATKLAILLEEKNEELENGRSAIN